MCAILTIPHATSCLPASPRFATHQPFVVEIFIDNVICLLYRAFLRNTALITSNFLFTFTNSVPIFSTPTTLGIRTLMCLVGSALRGKYCHAPIFWVQEPAENPRESDRQIWKSLNGDDYFKWYRTLKAILENNGECAIPFGNPRDPSHRIL